MGEWVGGLIKRDGWVGEWVGGKHAYRRTASTASSAKWDFSWQRSLEERVVLAMLIYREKRWVGGWVGGWVGWVEENEAVGMSYCELGVWVGGWASSSSSSSYRYRYSGSVGGRRDLPGPVGRPWGRPHCLPRELPGLSGPAGWLRANPERRFAGGRVGWKEGVRPVGEVGGWVGGWVGRRRFE